MQYLLCQALANLRPWNNSLPLWGFESLADDVPVLNQDGGVADADDLLVLSKDRENEDDVPAVNEDGGVVDAEVPVSGYLKFFSPFLHLPEYPWTLNSMPASNGFLQKFYIFKQNI